MGRSEEMEIAARQDRLTDARAEFLRADVAGLTTGPVRYTRREAEVLR
jgi:hypothetical protein